MKEPGLLLELGVGSATIGMALVALCVIVSPLFFPGLFVLTAGLLLGGAAGILYVLPRAQHGQHS